MFWSQRLTLGVVGVLFVTLLLLPVVVGARSGVRGVEVGGDEAGGVGRLVIITPHNDQIRYEIGLAFDRWHRERYGSGVEIDWRVIGGSADVERLLFSSYSGLEQRGQLDEGVGFDLVFGGGDYFFDRRLKPGLGSGEKVLERVELPSGLIAAAYPTMRIADKLLYDPDGMWYGTVLSSFGIVYNRDALWLLGVEEPRTWADLTDPRLYGWVALADPSHSGSVRVTYDAILQRAGFVAGLGILRRASANARYFANSSQKVPQDVSAGEMAAGMSIDFYGLNQAESVGGERIGYVAPAGQTVITADPIAMLRGAGNREVAARFMAFQLTEQGQAVWNFKVGARAVDGTVGPRRFALRRPPVRRDMYERYGEYLSDPESPFGIAAELAEGTPSYNMVVTPLLHAMAIDTHEELQGAWRAINGAGVSFERRARMLMEFDALPFSGEELLATAERWRVDGAARDEDRIAWTRFFRERYRRVMGVE